MSEIVSLELIKGNEDNSFCRHARSDLCAKHDAACYLIVVWNIFMTMHDKE